MANSNGFSKFATGLSSMAGKPATFVIAAVLVIVWAVSGPMFHFSDSWQLAINTSTTTVTFLMVFLTPSRRLSTKATSQTTATRTARAATTRIEP